MNGEHDPVMKLCQMCEHYDGGEYVTNECFDCINGCNFEHAGNNAEIALLTRDRDEWKQRAEAAESDINMCCPCEVCTRSCTYDKVNPYDECADFEWRGPCTENGGVKNGEISGTR